MRTLSLVVGAGAALLAVVSMLSSGPPAGPALQSGASGAGQPRAAIGDEGSSAAARYLAAFAMARNTQDAQNPVALYVAKPGVAGRSELDRIFVEGVPLTEQSVRSARALLKAGLSGDEKIALARILGRLYTPDNLTGYNADILLDLRALIDDGDKRVGRSAALAFARAGYLPGSDEVLKSAFDHGVLGADDYFGELAHMAPFAPARVQDDLLGTVKASGNAYAADVLASLVNDNPAALQAYSTRSVDEIRQLLGTTEPRFGPATSEFGLTDAVRYANWLRASAQIDSVSNGGGVDAAIVSRLGAPGTDPRKIMAYLLTPEASATLSSAQLGSPAGSLVSSAIQYAEHYPDSPMLQSAARDIASKVGQARKNAP